MEMVLGLEPPDEDDLMETEVMDMYRDATDLYGLIHARFILSPKGLQEMVSGELCRIGGSWCGMGGLVLGCR